MPDESQNRDCREQILSEDYLDIIVEIRSLAQDVNIREYLDEYCSQSVDFLTSILHLDRSQVPPYDVAYYGFERIPSLFSLQDTTSMSASGILRLQNQPLPGLRGARGIDGYNRYPSCVSQVERRDQAGRNLGSDDSDREATGGDLLWD